MIDKDVREALKSQLEDIHNEAFDGGYDDCSHDYSKVLDALLEAGWIRPPDDSLHGIIKKLRADEEYWRNECVSRRRALRKELKECGTNTAAIRRYMYAFDKECEEMGCPDVAKWDRKLPKEVSMKREQLP